MASSPEIVDLTARHEPGTASGVSDADADHPERGAPADADHPERGTPADADHPERGTPADADHPERGTPADADHPELWDALREVRDPEVPVSLVDLGLIYAVRRDDGRVEVDLSFTATACPAMDFIQDDIRERLLQEPGVEVVETRVVWSPPWTPERITDEGREALRRFGISL